MDALKMLIVVTGTGMYADGNDFDALKSNSGR